MADNIFDRLDDLEREQKAAGAKAEQQHEELLKELRRQGGASRGQSKASTVPFAQKLTRFVSGSVQTFLWFGTEESFRRYKHRLIVLLIAVIAAMAVSTAVTTACFHMYSTYTLFENLCLLLTIYVLVYVCRAKRSYEASDYERSSYKLFEPNMYGMLTVAKRKRRYTVLFILGFVAAALNAFCALILENVDAPLLIVLAEVLTWVLVAVAIHMTETFFLYYEGIFCFSNINLGEVLMYDALDERLFMEDDFYATFPALK